MFCTSLMLAHLLSFRSPWKGMIAKNFRARVIIRRHKNPCCHKMAISRALATVAADDIAIDFLRPMDGWSMIRDRANNPGISHTWCSSSSQHSLL